MFSAFFIDRPRFAIVVSVVIILAGALSLLAMPVAQFPPITPPVVQVSATYPGANAEVVEATVTTPIEEEVNGIDGMLYMSSQSSNNGQMTLTVAFAVGPILISRKSTYKTVSVSLNLDYPKRSFAKEFRFANSQPTS